MNVLSYIRNKKAQFQSYKHTKIRTNLEKENKKLEEEYQKRKELAEIAVKNQKLSSDINKFKQQNPSNAVKLGKGLAKVMNTIKEEGKKRPGIDFGGKGSPFK